MMLALALANVAAVTATAEQNGAKIYKANCAPCHGATGDANTVAGKKYNAKAFNAMELKMSDAELLEFVRNGKGDMPAWKDVLEDDELHKVLDYVRAMYKKPAQ
jgi:cytochrome c oxidase subunit 2